MRIISLFLGAAALAVSPVAAQTKSGDEKSEAGCVTSLEKRDDAAGYRLARKCAAQSNSESVVKLDRAAQPIEGEAQLGAVAPGVIGGILAALGITLGIILDDDDDDNDGDGGVDPASP